MKRIVFIAHALERLRDRKISKELVIQTLNEPDSVDTGYLGRKISQKILNGKLIRVIYEETEDEILVITAYITSKVEKYTR